MRLSRKTFPAFTVIDFFIFTVFKLTGCENDLPLQYRYLFPEEIKVKYKGTDYLLTGNQQKAGTPFACGFQVGGGLDIL